MTLSITGGSTPRTQRAPAQWHCREQAPGAILHHSGSPTPDLAGFWPRPIQPTYREVLLHPQPLQPWSARHPVSTAGRLRTIKEAWQEDPAPLLWADWEPPPTPRADTTATLFLCPDLQTLRVAFAVLGKGCFGISLTSISVYKPELYPTVLR